MLDAWKRLSSLKLLPISQAAMDPARAAIDDVLAEALGGAVDPTRYFVKYGDNMWAAVKGYLDEVTRRSRAGDREVHGRARGRRRLHREHDLLGDGVDPARPRLRLPGASRWPAAIIGPSARR